jgi:ribosome-binding protein aMBF1 (putative translation factor)
MNKHNLNYVRGHRSRWGLSAEELARLLGRDPSIISRLERGRQTPGGKIALGLEVVFGVSPRDLFPGIHEQVEDTVMARAARLHDQLEGKVDRRSLQKRKLLEEMIKRAAGNERGV